MNSSLARSEFSVKYCPSAYDLYSVGTWTFSDIALSKTSVLLSSFCSMGKMGTYARGFLPFYTTYSMGFTSGNSLCTQAALFLAVPKGPSLAQYVIMLLSDTALVTSFTTVSSMSA